MELQRILDTFKAENRQSKGVDLVPGSNFGIKYPSVSRRENLGENALSSIGQCITNGETNDPQTDKALDLDSLFSLNDSSVGNGEKADAKKPLKTFKGRLEIQGLMHPDDWMGKTAKKKQKKESSRGNGRRGYGPRDYISLWKEKQRLMYGEETSSCQLLDQTQNLETTPSTVDGSMGWNIQGGITANVTEEIIHLPISSGTSGNFPLAVFGNTPLNSSTPFMKCFDKWLPNPVSGPGESISLHQPTLDSNYQSLAAMQSTSHLEMSGVEDQESGYQNMADQKAITFLSATNDFQVPVQEYLYSHSHRDFHLPTSSFQHALHSFDESKNENSNHFVDSFQAPNGSLKLDSSNHDQPFLSPVHGANQLLSGQSLRNVPNTNHYPDMSSACECSDHNCLRDISNIYNNELRNGQEEYFDGKNELGSPVSYCGYGSASEILSPVFGPSRYIGNTNQNAKSSSKLKDSKENVQNVSQDDLFLDDFINPRCPYNEGKPSRYPKHSMKRVSFFGDQEAKLQRCFSSKKRKYTVDYPSKCIQSASHNKSTRCGSPDLFESQYPPSGRTTAFSNQHSQLEKPNALASEIQNKGSGCFENTPEDSLFENFPGNQAVHSYHGLVPNVHDDMYRTKSDDSSHTSRSCSSENSQGAVNLFEEGSPPEETPPDTMAFSPKMSIKCTEDSYHSGTRGVLRVSTVEGEMVINPKNWHLAQKFTNLLGKQTEILSRNVMVNSRKDCLNQPRKVLATEELVHLYTSTS